MNIVSKHDREHAKRIKPDPIDPRAHDYKVVDTDFHFVPDWQLLRKYLGPCPQVLAFCRFRQRQGHALPGARACLDPASKLQFVLIPGADLVKEAF